MYYHKHHELEIGKFENYITEFRSISELKKLLSANCKIEKIDPPVFASDAEVNIVTVTLLCPDGKTQTIRAYREEAQSLREFIRMYT